MNFEPLSLAIFPPALFDRLLKEIQAFSQHENESLTDAWLRMKEMLRNCHGHKLSKSNIIKIFYHALSRNDLKKLVELDTEQMIFNIDSAMKHSYSNDDTCFSIDVIDEILEEDFDALLEEGSKILYSIEGTLLDEEIFVKFDEFMEMTADENSDSESDTEDPHFKKITINTDYKIKTSLEEPPIDL
ncbi:hypothetical protein Tco_0382800 [Tanacetum coccineum]